MPTVHGRGRRPGAMADRFRRRRRPRASTSPRASCGRALPPSCGSHAPALARAGDARAPLSRGSEPGLAGAALARARSQRVETLSAQLQSPLRLKGREARPSNKQSSGRVSPCRNLSDGAYNGTKRRRESSVVARPTDSNEQLLCSFCGKSQRQVKKLIAGPGVYICDECIDLCNEIIDEELTAAAQLRAREPAEAGRDLRRPAGVRGRPGEREAGALGRCLQPLQARADGRRTRQRARSSCRSRTS